MTLGIDARPLQTPRNGIGRYTTAILEELRRHTDWQLVLFVTSASVKVPGCETVRVPARLRSNFLGFQLHTAALCRRLEVDVFFSPRHHLPQGLGIPAVVTIHDLVWKLFPETMRFPGALIERLLMPAALRSAKRVIAVSESTAADVARYFPLQAKKVSVVYEGVFESPAAPTPPAQAPPPGRRFVLAVGTQEPRKNYPRLIDAFATLTTRFPDLDLVIVGGAGWRQNLRQHITDTAMDERVVLIEDARDDEIAWLYKHCLFLAQLSFYEGFGLPVAEAKAAGRPAVASDRPALPEIAGDAAVTVNPACVESIADGMSRLLTTPALLAELSLAARERAKRFSWHKAGLRTIEVIAAAAGR